MGLISSNNSFQAIQFKQFTGLDPIFMISLSICRAIPWQLPQKERIVNEMNYLY